MELQHGYGANKAGATSPPGRAEPPPAKRLQLGLSAEDFEPRGSDAELMYSLAAPAEGEGQTTLAPEPGPALLPGPAPFRIQRLPVAAAPAAAATAAAPSPTEPHAGGAPPLNLRGLLASSPDFAASPEEDF